MSQDHATALQPDDRARLRLKKQEKKKEKKRKRKEIKYSLNSVYSLQWCNLGSLQPLPPGFK